MCASLHNQSRLTGPNLYDASGFHNHPGKSGKPEKYQFPSQVKHMEMREKKNLEKLLFSIIS